nr:unnamed protein product [Callosobruchus analis]
MDSVENRKARDESTFFGEHVAAKHRKYSQYTKSVVEHLITHILFKADMGCYEKNTANQRTSNLNIYSKSSTFGINACNSHAIQSSNVTPNSTPVPSASPTLSLS